MHDEWLFDNYNSSNWVIPISNLSNGASPWNKLNGIADNAKWIWIDSYNTVGNPSTIFCRAFI